MAKFVSKENLNYFYSKIKTPVKFAQEEYNKGLNLFNANVNYRFSSYNDYISTGEGSVSLKDVGSNSTYAVSETKYTLDQFVFKATFSNDYPRYLFVPYDANGNVMKDLTINGLKSYNSVYKAYYVDSQYLSLTKPSNVAYYKLGFVITSGTATQQIVGASNMILVEGSNVPSAYTPYQGGEIVHKGDIDPVLLWKNGNPESDLVNAYLTLPDMTPYKWLLIGYRGWKTFGTQYLLFERKVSVGLSVMYMESGNIKIRTFNIDDNVHIWFGEAYDGATNSNNGGVCVPEFIYGIK